MSAGEVLRTKLLADFEVGDALTGALLDEICREADLIARLEAAVDAEARLPRRGGTRGRSQGSGSANHQWPDGRSLSRQWPVVYDDGAQLKKESQMRLSKEFRVAYFRESPDGAFDVELECYGIVDKLGDRVVPGALSKSIGEWKAYGEPIPLVDSGRVIGGVDPSTICEFEAGLVPYAPKGGLRFRGYVKAEYSHIGLLQLALGIDTVKEKRAEDGASNIVTAELIEITTPRSTWRWPQAQSNPQEPEAAAPTWTSPFKRRSA